MNNAQEDMLVLAKKAMKNAYSPYSNFNVGVCIKTTDGELHAGCNIENAAYTMIIHAEASAIANMISANGQQQIAEVVVIGSSDMPCTPCGTCRQLLSEFSSPDTQIHMYSKDTKTVITKTLAELLPMSFNNEFLLASSDGSV